MSVQNNHCLYLESKYLSYTCHLLDLYSLCWFLIHERKPFRASEKEALRTRDAMVTFNFSIFAFPISLLVYPVRLPFHHVVVAYTRKPRMRVDYDDVARISLSRKSASRFVRYTLLRSTANSILVNIVFIEQPHKIRITVQARKHRRFLSRKILSGPFSSVSTYSTLFILPSRLMT